jgi:hypothetical protein
MNTNAVRGIEDRLPAGTVVSGNLDGGCCLIDAQPKKLTPDVQTAV